MVTIYKTSNPIASAVPSQCLRGRQDENHSTRLRIERFSSADASLLRWPGLNQLVSVAMGWSLTGIALKVSTPEDTILAKLRWAKESGGSEKQFNDALGVYEVQRARLDLAYLDDWANRLDVAHLWARVKAEATPV